MTPPSRILLIRLSAIGDIVMASPLIAALRRAYPQAHIAWLVQAEGAPLLRHHPDLNQVITLAPRRVAGPVARAALGGAVAAGPRPARRVAPAGV
jgi:heptosyltransferase-1